MQQSKVLLVAGVLLAWNSLAHAGAPSWCKGKGAFDKDAFARQPNDVERAAYLVRECQPDAGGEGDKARAAFAKRLAMNDADWNDAVAWVDADGPMGGTIHDAKPSTNTFATLTPIDQFLVIYKGVDDPSGRTGAQPWYLADALEPNLTETGRLAFLASCVDRDHSLNGGPAPVYWSLCVADMAKLDPAKLGAEIRGDSAHSAKERFAVRLLLGDTVDNLQKWSEAAKQLVKKDDAYGKLFDVAKKGAADWQAASGSMTDLLALVQQGDSGTYFHSRKQLEACKPGAEKALAAAVSKIPAKTFTGMHDPVRQGDLSPGFAAQSIAVIVATPEGNLAATALALCDHESGWADALIGKLQYTPGYRGPRSAAYTAIASQKFPLDDTTEKEIRVPEPEGAKMFGSSIPLIISWSSIASSMKPGKDKETGDPVVIVASAKSSVTTEDCVKWHQTGKWTGWDTAGRPVYQEICDKTAVVKHDTTPNDWPVSPRSAAMLKSGTPFSVVTGGKVREVIGVWPNKTAKLPSMIFGGAVK